MSESTDTRQGGSTPGWKPGLQAGSTGQAGRSLIGPTVVIRGEVTAEEDLMIMGRIEGFIDHSSTVTIHTDGTVAAEVKAQEVLVEGRVDGNVYGTRRVQIAESGSVNGNVYAPRVGVLEGASFKGAIDMEADVSVIERRFREKTGTQAPEGREAADRDKDSAGKTSDSKVAAKAKGDSDAAQADEEGHANDATGAAAGSDARSPDAGG